MKGNNSQGSSGRGFWGMFGHDQTIDADNQEGQFLQPQVIHGYRPVSLWGVMVDANAWGGYLLRQVVALTPHPLGIIGDLGGTLAFGTFIKYASIYGFMTLGFYVVIPVSILIASIAVGSMALMADSRTRLPVMLRLFTMTLGVVL